MKLAKGFQVTLLAARVLWNLPSGTIAPRSHMVLWVNIDGEPYIADVGFGGLTLTTPLALTPDIEQPTSHEPFRLIATDRSYIMQAYIKQEWKSLYTFDQQEQELPDYEVSNTKSGLATPVMMAIERLKRSIAICVFAAREESGISRTLKTVELKVRRDAAGDRHSSRRSTDKNRWRS